MAGATSPPCVFCQIAINSTSTTTLLHADDKVVAFQDIKPAAFRHYLVIPVEHIPTVKDLQRRDEDYSLVSHMLNVGQTLLRRDAPQSKHYRLISLEVIVWRSDPLEVIWLSSASTEQCQSSTPPLFGTTLHPQSLYRWKHVKYLSLGPLGGFIEAEKLLEKIKPS